MRSKNKSLHEHSKSAALLIEVVNDFARLHRVVRHTTWSILYDEDDLAQALWLKEKYRVRQQLARMKKQNLINYKQQGDRYRIALTDSGLIEAVREQVLSADLFEDDRVCIVVFDIPESQRRIRKLLRNFLTKAAFIPIQRSVWISPFDAGDQLMKLFQLTGATRWVQVFSGSRHEFRARR